MPKKDPHPKRGGGNKGRDVKDERPLSSHACLSLNLICLLFYSLLFSSLIHRQRPSLFIDNSHNPISIELLIQTCFESVHYLSKKDSHLRQDWRHIWRPLCTYAHTHVGWFTTRTIPGAGQPKSKRVLVEVGLHGSHPKRIQFESNSKLVQNNFERLSILNSLGLQNQV